MSSAQQNENGARNGSGAVVTSALPKPADDSFSSGQVGEHVARAAGIARDHDSTATEETASDSIEDNSTEVVLRHLAIGLRRGTPQQRTVARLLLSNKAMSAGGTSIRDSMDQHALSHRVYEALILAVTDRAEESDLDEQMELGSWAAQLGDENLIIEYAISKTPTTPAIVPCWRKPRRRRP